jgi:type I restriction enzyme S subunit
MSSAIQMEEKWLNTVRTLVSEHVPNTEVRAFGSRVTGTARKWSDLDLVVLPADTLDRQAISRLVHALQESDLPYRVDVVDARFIDDEFREAILGSSVPLAA